MHIGIMTYVYVYACLCVHTSRIVVGMVGSTTLLVLSILRQQEFKAVMLMAALAHDAFR